MKYSEYLSSAKRHNHTCKVLKEKLEQFEEVDHETPEYRYINMSLYYIAGYIIECSLKYKILECFGHDQFADVSKNSCSGFEFNFHNDFKIHKLTKLHELLDTKVSDVFPLCNEEDINELLSGWKPDIRYEDVQCNYQNIISFYNYTRQFLTRI